MKKIAILTSTRADYGLLSPLIKKFKLIDELKTEVLVTGTHLSPEFGMTINEIIKDGVSVDKRIEILLTSDDSPIGVSKAMSMAISNFSNYFEDSKPDALLVLGDRFECLAVCLAAQNSRIPIIHLHGGEITEGAIDNAFRHCITKLSYLHFASTEAYRNRIIQMGESPDRVFNVGAIGVENVLNTALYCKGDCEKHIGFGLNKYAVLIFHPVTLENQTAEFQARELLNTLVSFCNITFICLKANADMGGRTINAILEEFSSKFSNIKLFDSLSNRLYLSLVKNSLFVIGNSSSGIIEVPSFKVPTINIGDRQKGRIQAISIINCEPIKESIDCAIKTALSSEFLDTIKNVSNPYEGKNTSDSIVKITCDYLFKGALKMQKTFYDIDFKL